MAFALIEVNPQVTTSLKNAESILQNGTIVFWEVAAAISNNRCILNKQLNCIVKFASERKEIIQSCDAIVIEQQPSAKMRNIAMCLYGICKCYNENAYIVFQPGYKKLAWSDLTTYCSNAKTTTYYDRKKTAISVCQSLISEVDRKILSNSKKKDDLSDSLLHALKFACS